MRKSGTVRIGLILLLALLMLIVGQAVTFAAPLEGPAPQAAPDYSGTIINGVSLLFVVIGLVQVVKLAGAKGNWLRISAVGIGTVLGILYQVSLGTTPTFAYWFGAAIYGLGLGIVSFSLVDAVRDSITSAVRTANGGG